ncbi:hypothetical protein [Streptomyces sp. NPDC090025]|uniref:hypothetical protein n=1 Tax=Streptomyces sp. NPDC090025 TaxID=3365922 RepID=UPI0038381D3C
MLAYPGALLVPFGSGWLLYRWATWSMHSSAVPTFVSIAVGLALTVVALLALGVLFRASGSIFALVLLFLGLASVWVEARDARVRPEVVDCVVVGKVTVTEHPTFGDGAPESKTLFHHTLDCVGGYPRDFAAEEKIGDDGTKTRIAIDPDRRLDPVLARDNKAIGSPVIPTVVLSLAALLTVVTLVREGRPGRDPADAS